MKNIINEKPDKHLTGRLAASVKIIDKNTDILGKDILDIGCGYGWFENFCIENNCKSILGIEITDEDLKTIRNNIQHEKLSTSIGSAIDIPSKENSVDVATAWEVIEHIPFGTEDKMFKEVNRVLKPGGVFYLSTPFASLPSNLFDPAWYFGHRHYSVKQLEDFGAKHGFEIVDYWIFGDWWLILDMINMYTAKWIFRRRKFFAEFFNEKVESTYGKISKDGFVNIFVKFKKK
jgi:cyclopropane fatty-acyl-phospholipid synthase-like methyltransferase